MCSDQHVKYRTPRGFPLTSSLLFDYRVKQYIPTHTSVVMLFTNNYANQQYYFASHFNPAFLYVLILTIAVWSKIDLECEDIFVIVGDSYVLYLSKSTKGTYINAITVDVSLLAGSIN